MKLRPDAEADLPPHSAAPSAESLIRAATRAVRAGNRPAARAIVRSITRDFPDEVRGWMALADLAADDGERLAALERVVALALDNERARQALELLRETRAPTVADSATTTFESAAPTTAAWVPAARDLPDVPPVEVEQQPHRGWLWPTVAITLLLVAGVVCLALMVPSLFTVAGSSSVSQQPREATLPQQAADGAAAPPPAPATMGATVPTETVAAASALPAPTATAAATRVAPTPSPPTATAGVAATATRAPLAAGALVELDGWRATLPRDDRVLLLDGAVGNVQPQGRLVLAVVSLANISGQPRRVPADLFVLIDGAGRSYRPQPALSTAYLAAYGRGLRGDLSLEDELPGNGGYFSVPVLFDVPRDAQGLRLSVGDGSVGGWAVPGGP